MKNLKNFFFISFFIIFYFLLSTINYKITYAEENNWVGLTATSDNHFLVTLNFILSFFLFYPNNILIVYDMDLNNSNRITLNLLFRILKLYLKENKNYGKIFYRYFNFSCYPPHFSVENYTWKQIMIYNTINYYKKMIFWFDGGVEIIDSLKYEISVAKERGIYFEPSPFPINVYLPNSVANYFNVDKTDLSNYKTINIALVCIKYDKEIIDEIIKPWVNCALNSNCICPTGVSRKDYRYDQTTLFLILYKSKKYKYLIHAVKENNKSHKKQCDHRKDCNLKIKLSQIFKELKN